MIFDLFSLGTDEFNYVRVPGNDIRQMAGRVIEDCVEKSDDDEVGGGFITKNLEILLHSVSTPGNHFFENPRSHPTKNLLTCFSNCHANINVLCQRPSLHS